MKRHRIAIKGELLLKLLKHQLVELDPMRFGDCVNSAKSILSTEGEMEIVGVDFNISNDTVHIRCLSEGKAGPWISETRSHIEHEEQLGFGCGECGGKGVIDTGAVQPWGEFIEAPCGCKGKRCF